MRDNPAVAVLAETYLSFIRSREDFLLFEQRTYEHGFEIINNRCKSTSSISRLEA